MRKHTSPLLVAMALSIMPSTARAWDHPGHMLTAAIAFAEIQRVRPDLIEKLGLLFLTHPQTAPFWVAMGEAKGTERVRRMFIECARWADDNKFRPWDHLTWHSARWAVVAKDATPEAKAAAAARDGQPVGQAIDALRLNLGTLANAESSPSERALALCWVMHVAGDIHQPLHVSDLFSKDFPTGNGAGSMSYVMDPVTRSPITLHILWDSNKLRVPSLMEVDRAAQEYTKRYPRSSLAELKATPITDPDVFRKWAWESHQIALDWAFDVKSLPDPNKGQPAEKLVQGMINFILNGVAPVKEAPDLPAGYWEKLEETTERRLTLAGYRLADLLISVADRIDAQRKFADM